MPENSKGMIIHSVCGGFCAAASSFCGKLAGLHETSTLALLGLLVFRESTSLLWWCGASMVLLGLFFICQPQKQHKT
ncbi:hypothetical protein C0J52_21782 [Blattella germanica]|nr:hypothetical protein C0J52_21782 [Blattella germanica]